MYYNIIDSILFSLHSSLHSLFYFFYSITFLFCSGQIYVVSNLFVCQSRELYQRYHCVCEYQLCLINNRTDLFVYYLMCNVHFYNCFHDLPTDAKCHIENIYLLPYTNRWFLHYLIFILYNFLGCFKFHILFLICHVFLYVTYQSLYLYCVPIFT